MRHDYTYKTIAIAVLLAALCAGLGRAAIDLISTHGDWVVLQLSTHNSVNYQAGELIVAKRQTTFYYMCDMERQQTIAYKPAGSIWLSGSKTAIVSVDDYARRVDGLVLDGQLMFLEAVDRETFNWLKSMVMSGSRMTIQVGRHVTRLSLSGSSAAIRTAAGYCGIR